MRYAGASIGLTPACCSEHAIHYRGDALAATGAWCADGGGRHTGRTASCDRRSAGGRDGGRARLARGVSGRGLPADDIAAVVVAANAAVEALSIVFCCRSSLSSARR